VKIQDARLGHTISRDDVRRDQHYERAIAFARDVAHDDLVKAAASALHAAADAHDLDRHRSLMLAITASELSIDRGHLHVPIVEPVGGKHSVPSNALDSPAWTSHRASPLTSALAAEGTPVVYVTESHDVAALPFTRLRHVETELTCITAIEPTDADEALVALLDEIFDAVHRRPDGIVLARLLGARADRLAIAGKYADQSHVVDRDEAARDPFALLRKRVLVLSVEHPQVAAARSGDPVVAASHLARAVLLQHRLLDADRSRGIVEYALARVGVDR